MASNEGTRTTARISDGWLGINIAPILSFMTLLLSFFLFVYFVNISLPHGTTNDDMTRSLALLNDLTQKYASAADPEERTRLKESIGLVQKAVDSSRLVLAEQSTQKGMMKDFVLYILGVLSSIITTIFGYYFGSSKGSSKKDDTLTGLASRAGGKVEPAELPEGQNKPGTTPPAEPQKPGDNKD